MARRKKKGDRNGNVKPARSADVDGNLSEAAEQALKHKKRLKIQLRRAARFLYDMQALRISTTNRSATEKVELEKDDLAFLSEKGKDLKEIEASMDKELLGILRQIPIWTKWLVHQKGIGPRLGHC